MAWVFFWKFSSNWGTKLVYFASSRLLCCHFAEDGVAARSPFQLTALALVQSLAHLMRHRSDLGLKLTNSQMETIGTPAELGTFWSKSTCIVVILYTSCATTRLRADCVSAGKRLQACARACRGGRERGRGDAAV
eukprot:6178946-Pleurochrysis_carterae.AAC.1